MAGIGFELRKLYGKKTLLSSIYGTIYATMTTIGPSVLFAFLVIFFKVVMEYFRVSELENRFFISSFTYIFLSAILISSFFNTIVSRFISDCIFQKRENEISSSVFGVLTCGSIWSGMIMLYFCIRMYINDQIPIRFLALYYILGILATAAYNMITYVSALKQYLQVTVSYFIGILLGIISFFILYKIMHLHIIMAMYIGLMITFVIINFLLILICMRAFGKPNQNIFLFLTYIKKHFRLFVSGACYMLGFYATSIIYWNLSDLSEKISIFKTAPNYDMAFFLAIIVNMPALVIFVVKTETLFYEKYISYLSALNNGSYHQIEKERLNVSNIIRLQLFFIYEVQLIITIVLICLINVFFPYINVNAEVLNMFLILSMGLYSVFCMYFTVVFLYYFDDQKGSCYGPILFFIITVMLAILFSFVGKPYYPLALLVGGIIGWIISFLRLKRLLSQINKYLLCK